MRTRKGLVTIIIFALIGAGLAYYLVFLRQVDPIPSSIKSKTSFIIMYPKSLPKGYALDEKSFNSNGEVLTYSIRSPYGSIPVSVQHKPTTFDFKSFYEKGMSGSLQFSTAIGSAAAGTAEGRTIGSLTTGNSWLLLTSPSDSLPLAQAQTILQSMVIAN